MAKLNHKPKKSPNFQAPIAVIVGLGGLSAGIYLINFKIIGKLVIFLNPFISSKSQSHLSATYFTLLSYQDS